MKQYDAIIIGAGPIGCYTAQLVAKQFHQVALIEEHPRVGEPLQCAGLVTKRVFDITKLPQTSLVLNTIKGAIIHAPQGGLLTIGGDKTHALVIDRIGFDQALSQQACDAGTEIFLSSKATAIYKKETSISVDLTQQETKRTLTGSVLIGADGPHSVVRTLFKFPAPKEVLRGIGATVTNISLDPKYVHIYLGSNIAPGFFAWIIPTNKIGNEARIGLCCNKTALPKQCFNHLLKQPLLNNATITNHIGGTIPLGPLKRTVHDHILLVGDAAAQVKPTSGGGIYPGLVCARHCATAVNEALQDSPVNQQLLDSYHATWTKDIGKELSIGMQFRKIYQQLTEEQFDTYLQKFNDDKTRDTINTYGDIDYPSKLAFPLLKNVPSLLKFLPFLFKRSQ